MATVVESTIGGTTPDYSTIELWLADTEVNLVTADEVQRGLMRSATFSEILDITGATGDATRYRELTFDTGARYDPSSDTGAKVTGTTTGQTVDAWENYFRITGICIARGAAATGGNCIWVNTNGTGVILDAVTFRVDASSGGTEGCFGAVAGPIFRNCIAFRESYDGSGEGISSGGAKIHNCCSYGFNVGISWTDAADIDIINCISEIGTGGDSSFFQYAADTSGTYSHNIAITDGFAPGTNATQSAVSEDTWVEASAFDFRLTTGSSAIDNATYLGAQFTTSFDGTDRTTTSSTWDAGAYEYTAGGAASSLDISATVLTLSSPDTTISAAKILAVTPTVLTLSSPDTSISAIKVLSPTASIINLAAPDVTIPVSGIQLVVNMDTSTTIVAGQSIFFDNIGTSAETTSKPYHHLRYVHNFGDDSNLDNILEGPVVCHAYRDPGTYTYVCSAFDISGNTDTSSVEITVQDPSAVFPLSSTVSFSNDGTFTGASPSSNQITTSDWNDVATHLARGTRVELKKGDTYTSNNGTSVTVSSGTGVAMISAYGTGENPIVDISGTFGGAGNALTISEANTIVIRDITFSYTGGTTSQNIAVIANDHQTINASILDLSADGFTAGVNIGNSGPEFYGEDPNESIAIHRVTQTTIPGTQTFMFIGGERYAIIGVDIGDDVGDTAIRFTGGNYFVCARTTFRGAPVGVSQLKTHAAHWWATDADTSKYWNFYKNIHHECSAAWGHVIGPQNPVYDERIKDVVCDGSYFVVSGDSKTGQVVRNVRDITLRNNVFDLLGSTGGGVGQSIDEYNPSSFQTTSGVECYNNTMYASGAAIWDVIVTHIDEYEPTDSPIVKNNIVQADSYTGTVSAVYSVSATVVEGGNHIGTMNFVDPDNQDFSLSSNSSAIDAGVIVPNMGSFNDGLYRVLETSTDAGAYETEASSSSSSVDVDPTVITLGSLDTTITATKTLSVNPVIIALASPDLAVTGAKTLSVDPVIITLASPDSTVTGTKTLEVSTNPILLSAPDASIASDSAVLVNPTVITLSSADSTVTGAKTLAVTPTVITLASPDVNIQAEGALLVNPTEILLVSPNTSISATKTITVDPTILSLSSSDTTVTSEKVLAVSPTLLTLSVPDIALQLGTFLDVSATEILLNSPDVTLMYDAIMEVLPTEITIEIPNAGLISTVKGPNNRGDFRLRITIIELDVDCD